MGYPMSALRELRKKVAGPANAANPANSEAEIRNIRRLPTSLSEIDAALNAWLDHIGEIDEKLRAGLLAVCRIDPEARDYFLKRAAESSSYAYARQQIQGASRTRSRTKPG